MRPERKGARDALKAIPTKTALAAMLDEATLTDQQRQAVWLVYGEGMTRVKAAATMSASLAAVNKAIAASWDKLGR